jgi:hypothetical protein
VIVMLTKINLAKLLHHHWPEWNYSTQLLRFKWLPCMKRDLNVCMYVCTYIHNTTYIHTYVRTVSLSSPSQMCHLLNAFTL